MSDEPKIEAIPQYGKSNGDCDFDDDGMCRTHLISIAEHAVISQTTTMTREEARKRFPNAKLPDD